MKQKGISPMVAIVLLIATVVVVTGIVTGWGTTLFKGTAGTVEQQASNFTIQCAVGMIDIEKIYCTSDTDGLVGYWKLDSVNSSNYTLDTSGYGNDGKLYNYPCNPADCNLTDGKYGKALQFDGSDDYVDCGNDNSLNLTGSFTIEVWINATTDITGTEDVIFGKGKGLESGYSLMAYPTNLIALKTYQSGSYDMARTAAAVVIPGTIQHIVGTYSSGGVGKIFVDGVEKSLDAILNTDPEGGNIPAIIGAYYTGTDYNWRGLIDEVRIYNRALSADEIQRHYQHGVAVRALVMNIGQTNLGKNFTLGWTVNNTFNSSIVNLTADLTPGSIQWLSVYNITEAGLLQNVKVTSKVCPNVAREEKDISGIIC